MPPQEILSRDSVTVTVEAVIYFRVSNPVISVTNVNDPQFSTKLLAQTTLRNVLGTRTLSEMLSERDSIANVSFIYFFHYIFPGVLRISALFFRKFSKNLCLL